MSKAAPGRLPAVRSTTARLGPFLKESFPCFTSPPLDALKEALAKAGIPFDPTRLSNNREYYEKKQEELESYQRETARLAGRANLPPTDDPIDKALRELQISQRVLEALRPVAPEKRTPARVENDRRA